MFDGPIRGGTRGGQGEFKWSDVSADKDRENYLGHSINAPTGRWQKNKDVHWYNRDLKTGEAERLEEIRKVKEAEEDALAVALGFKPTVRAAPGSEPGPSTVEGGEKAKALEDPAILAAKEEKRRRKEERRRRKEEKREYKELKRARMLEHGSVKDGSRRSDEDRHALTRYSTKSRSRSRSRSRSPRRPSERSRGRSVPRSPSYDGGGYRSRVARDRDMDHYDQRPRGDRRRYDDRDDRGYRHDRRTDRW